ncbi:hypothetical protein Btru_000652 [Bulinus truncatus]|nr:hypothetical protein Btru_000652 [Bulinus truncatus]
MFGIYLLLYMFCAQIFIIIMSPCEEKSFIKQKVFGLGDDLHVRCNDATLGIQNTDTTEVKSFTVQIQYHNDDTVYKWIKSTEGEIYNITRVTPPGSHWDIVTSMSPPINTYFTPMDYEVSLTVKEATEKDSGLYSCYIQSDSRPDELSEWRTYNGISLPVHYAVKGMSPFPDDAEC